MQQKNKIGKFNFVQFKIIKSILYNFISKLKLFANLFMMKSNFSIKFALPLGNLSIC